MASRPAGTTSKPRAASSDMLARSKIPVWIVKALLSSGIKRVSQVSSMTDGELLALPGIGKRAVELIRSSQSARESGESQLPTNPQSSARR
ncbi:MULTISPECIES: helix-hairpin-helix domain-containing protein [Rhizobium]|uniref:helix-hairpin-helix domain-containing protein n=1 Tax=Rhizobium TaxID=379 RepID=UPI001FE792B0|nr:MULTISPECIES: helix-hairpin-helix domain-containing protein [Rhizobium]